MLQDWKDLGIFWIVVYNYDIKTYNRVRLLHTLNSYHIPIQTYLVYLIPITDNIYLISVLFKTFAKVDIFFLIYNTLLV